MLCSRAIAVRIRKRQNRIVIFAHREGKPGRIRVNKEVAGKNYRSKREKRSAVRDEESKVIPCPSDL